MTVQELHHITIVCDDAQRTVDFCTGMLGHRLEKDRERIEASLRPRLSAREWLSPDGAR